MSTKDIIDDNIALLLLDTEKQLNDVKIINTDNTEKQLNDVKIINTDNTEKQLNDVKIIDTEKQLKDVKIIDTDKQLNDNINTEKQLNNIKIIDTDNDTKKQLNNVKIIDTDNDTKKQLKDDTNTEKQLYNDINTKKQLNDDTDTEKQLNDVKIINTDNDTKKQLKDDTNTEKQLDNNINNKKQLNDDTDTEKQLNDVKIINTEKQLDNINIKKQLNDIEIIDTDINTEKQIDNDIQSLLKLTFFISFKKIRKYHKNLSMYEVFCLCFSKYKKFSYISLSLLLNHILLVLLILFGNKSEKESSTFSGISILGSTFIGASILYVYKTSIRETYKNMLFNIISTIYLFLLSIVISCSFFIGISKMILQTIGDELWDDIISDMSINHRTYFSFIVLFYISNVFITFILILKHTSFIVASHVKQYLHLE